MFNQGVKRVQDMLRDNGNKPAEFDVSKLTVFCVNVFSAESDAQEGQGTNQNDGTINVLEGFSQLTDRQRKIYDIIKNGTVNGTVNAQTLSAALSISLRTAKRDLYFLRDMNLIKFVGSDKTGHWEVFDQQKT
jgi:predicted HTH transcriptional regulator